MPEELWTEVHDIVQEAVIRTIAKGKKKKTKWQNGCLWRPYKGKVLKAKEKRKDTPISMQSSKEQQGEIRKPSSVINEKK